MLVGSMLFFAADDLMGTNTYVPITVTALVTAGDKNGNPHFYVYYNVNGRVNCNEAPASVFFGHKVGDSLGICRHEHKFTHFVAYFAPWVIR
jgi:hypothetical protein